MCKVLQLNGAKMKLMDSDSCGGAWCKTMGQDYKRFSSMDWRSTHNL